MDKYIKLPEDITTKQIEIYNKNCELHHLALKNKNRYGVLLSMCAGLGIQDVDFLDVERFINVYPYNEFWHSLAYGNKYDEES